MTYRGRLRRGEAESSALGVSFLGHPLQTSIDVASLAPNAEITVFPWKEPEELTQRTIDRVRRFLKAHVRGSSG
jgi:hypothetical protein